MHAPRILIAEDENALRFVLKRLFEKKGYEVEAVPDGEMALHKLKSELFEVALVDIQLPRKTGFEILGLLQKEKPNLSLILMTAQDTVKNAIEAMKQGAFDYLTKPFDLEEVEAVVEKAVENARLVQEVEQLKAERKPALPDHLGRFVGKSKALQEIYKWIGKVSNSSAPVLITGESGTGKELVAKAIHFSGGRCAFPFIAVNCAAIPRDLLESELFGYRKGAFTDAKESRVGYFEAAHRGTLFLDEIGEMPGALQSKLLRVLQEREISPLGSREAKPVDVRIISATHQDLQEKIAEKKFREDLYFRLNVLPIEIPPLRKRAEDIPLLLDFFLERFQQEFSLPPKKIAKEAIEKLKRYSWPGNVRELENLVKRLLITLRGSIIQAKELEPLLKERGGGNPLFSVAQTYSLEEMLSQRLEEILQASCLDSMTDLYSSLLEQVERPLFFRVLEKTRGNQLQAARILGINRNTLRKRMRELGIQ